MNFMCKTRVGAPLERTGLSDAQRWAVDGGVNLRVLDASGLGPLKLTSDEGPTCYYAYASLTVSFAD